MRAPVFAFLAAIVAAAFAPQSTAAQTPVTSSPAPAGALKVFLACDSCDRPSLRTVLGFVDFVDLAVADVEVTLHSSAEGTDQRWTLVVGGRGTTAGQKRTITYLIPQTASAEDARATLARFLKLGLAEYTLATPLGPQFDVAFERPVSESGASPIKKDQKDRWNYWVYRVGAESYGDGEQSAFSSSYYLNASASRTTENWKMRIGASRSLNKRSFTIADNLTIKSRLTDWSVDSLLVKSLSPHWSAALQSSVIGSTFSNSKLVGQFTPGVEYDIFPYGESSRRSLTIQYTIGGAHYDYETETIFAKLSETISTHAVNTSLGLRQPWGQAGGSFVVSQHLRAPERTRISFNGSFSIRLVKSLTLNSSGSYSRIRDLFTLEKGDASDEEVLLRQRQLATGFRYSFSVGFGYSFGALSNATVNPRFGG